MLRKVEDRVLYRKSCSTPAATLPDFSALLVFGGRRPALAAGADAPETCEAARSRASRRPAPTGRQCATGRGGALPMNPRPLTKTLAAAAEQRAPAAGVVCLGMFPPFVAEVRRQVPGCTAARERWPLLRLYGGFVRARTTPVAPGATPLPAAPSGVGPDRATARHGGAVRGRAVESAGEILLPVYASPRPGAPSAAYVYVSDDGGESWRLRACIAQDDRVHMHEPALHRCPSGKIVCFLRTANLEDHLVTAESHDNGHTWSPWQQRPVIGHPTTRCRSPTAGCCWSTATGTLRSGFGRVLTTSARLAGPGSSSGGWPGATWVILVHAAAGRARAGHLLLTGAMASAIAGTVLAP